MIRSKLKPQFVIIILLVSEPLESIPIIQVNYRLFSSPLILYFIRILSCSYRIYFSWMWWYIFIGKRRSKWWMFRDVTSSRWSVYYGWAGSIFTSCCAASFDALRIARTRFSLVNSNSKFKIEKLPWPMSDQYKYPTSKLMIQRRKTYSLDIYYEYAW